MTKKKSKGTGLVYIIGLDNDEIILGTSKDYRKRLSQLKKEIGTKGEIICQWNSQYHLGYAETERKLKDKLGCDLNDLLAYASQLDQEITDSVPAETRQWLKEMFEGIG